MRLRQGLANLCLQLPGDISLSTTTGSVKLSSFFYLKDLFFRLIRAHDLQLCHWHTHTLTHTYLHTHTCKYTHIRLTLSISLCMSVSALAACIDVLEYSRRVYVAKLQLLRLLFQTHRLSVCRL